jgi:hypothetical protein
MNVTGINLRFQPRIYAIRLNMNGNDGRHINEPYPKIYTPPSSFTVVVVVKLAPSRDPPMLPTAPTNTDADDTAVGVDAIIVMAVLIEGKRKRM